MEPEKIRVLYLDDEKNNLISFKANFRSLYTVFTASSIEEATKVLDEIPIHVVIADQKMPGSTGVDFFCTLLTTHPLPIRILLTGYADIEAVIDAINKGKVYRYIKKPWDRHEIQLAVENGYEIYKTREELRIKTEQLEKVNSELSRFVYSTSHDLKAPIMTMLGVMKLRRWKEELLKMTPFYRSYTKALRN